jgi:hypothetical protein
MRKKTKKILHNIISSILLLAPGIAFAQSGWNISSVSGFSLPSGTIYNIAIQILNWLLALLGILGIIGFVISGFLYLTSVGEEGQMEKAKKAMLYSIMGVIVGLSGYVLIKAVETMLGGQSSIF